MKENLLPLQISITYLQLPKSVKMSALVTEQVKTENINVLHNTRVSPQNNSKAIFLH